jgi:hypothetical protein
MDCDYTKRSYLLPEGCKDLIDVLKLKQKQKFAQYLFAKPPMYWKKIKPGKQPAPLPQDWKDFFDTYWKLIYETALKAGLTDDEAQDVVQEVIIEVARQTPKLNYDPAKGSFKAWLLHLTRWRIADKLRKKSDNDAK